MGLSSFDVVSLVNETKKITPGKTFTVMEFARIVGTFLPCQRNIAQTTEWVKDGVDCCVLRPGSESWVKGKARISVALNAQT